MSTPLLEVTNLTLQVGARTLVRELTFAVTPGELWCLLGPNGAGKTTLLHTIVGLRDAQGGAIALEGRALEDWPAAAAARRRAFLPQTLYDAFSSSVLESVMLGRHPYLSRWDWEDEAERALAATMLTAVDLTGFEGRDVLSLSGGERQRVALATVLVQDAPLMLLDEPVSHLDLHHQVMVLDHFRTLAQTRGVAVLFTVHDLNLAARYATHVLMLMPTAAARHGPAAEVMNERNLESAFGHRVTRFEVAAGRTLFLPE